MLKIAIITGSIREGRLNKGVAEWVLDFAQKVEGIDAEFELIDIADYELDRFTGKPPASLKGNYDKAEQARFNNLIDEFDGYIFVTPEYNKNITGALKDAIDHVGIEFRDKAAAIVSYGSTMGVAASYSLRQTLSNLGVAVVRPFGSFSTFHDFEDGPNGKVFKPMEVHDTNMKTVVKDVVRWSTAMKTLR